jgi:asparagine synthase (glutamine-hydrolysing)
VCRTDAGERKKQGEIDARIAITTSQFELIPVQPMCGIGGIYSTSRIERADALLAETRSRLRYRGPDGEGQWLASDESVGLCHTRLAILDLSPSGAQPMVTADGHCTLTFNGEIYNWIELRAELRNMGFRFTSNSDSEVLLAAWGAWGENMLRRLRGMYAFALYDNRSRSLFCARDRVGKKPLVYATGPQGFAFASAIPALLPLARAIGTDLSPDHAALATMLLHNLRHIPDPATAYKGLRRLRPGHALIVQDGRIKKMWRYWDVAAEIEQARNTAKSGSQAVRAVLEQSVELRRVADVPVGSLLSGGTDSSAITALAQSRSSEPLRTYAFGSDADDEDIARARSMSKRLGTVHREFYFDPSEQWPVFQKLLMEHGEPIMSFPLLHTYQLCRAIRNDGLKVVLAGHGADEIFYGYLGHFTTARLSSAIHRVEGIRALLAMVPQPWRPLALSAAIAPRGSRKAALYRSYAGDLWRHIGLSDPEFFSAELRLWGEAGPHEDYIDESNFVALLVENAHSVTIASDLPAMLAPVEVRAPFLDQDMIALALALSWRTKIPADGDPTHLKEILKQAVSDIVPPDLLYAPKRGFGHGIAQHDVLLGAWREEVDGAVRAMPAGHWLNSKWVRRVWDRVQRGARAEWSVMARIFSILAWEQRL